MGVLTIRNLEDEIILGLKDQARTNRRSLEAEVRAILDREVRQPRPTPETLLALADRIAAMTPPVPQTDSALLLRGLRDGRQA